MKQKQNDRSEALGCHVCGELQEPKDIVCFAPQGQEKIPSTHLWICSECFAKFEREMEYGVETVAFNVEVETIDAKSYQDLARWVRMAKTTFRPDGTPHHQPSAADSQQWDEMSAAARSEVKSVPPEECPESKDPNTPTNENRSAWAEVGLKAYAMTVGVDTLETAVQDFLNDLAHWCDRHGLQLEELRDNAAEHYHEETDGKGTQFHAL